MCKSGAEETQTTEIGRDMGMGKTVNYCGSTLEITITLSNVRRNEQVCQQIIITEQIVSQEYTGFSRVVRKWPNASHFEL